jgi:hypothetical protein
VAFRKPLAEFSRKDHIRNDFMRSQFGETSILEDTERYKLKMEKPSIENR